mmetsp:Transcript_15748/g.19803  ORF Transcript_15748/g.19803 Transcript_15748/m.19803 type:complete len:89 (+) Transcript_15748:168-434(+)
MKIKQSLQLQTSKQLTCYHSNFRAFTWMLFKINYRDKLAFYRQLFDTITGGAVVFGAFIPPEHESDIDSDVMRHLIIYELEKYLWVYE